MDDILRLLEHRALQMAFQKITLNLDSFHSVELLENLFYTLKEITDQIDPKDKKLKSQAVRTLSKVGFAIFTESSEKGKTLLHSLFPQLLALGKGYFADGNFFLAEQLLTNSHMLAETIGSDRYMVIFAKYLILSQLGYFHDIARAANMYRYFGDIERGIGLAWRALVLSLDIIMRCTNYGLDLVNIVRQIKSSFYICQSILLEINDDTAPVVELKLHELFDVYELLSDDVPDTYEQIANWVATHRESLQFLIPQESPSILILKDDGRVLHYVSITQDLHSNLEPFAHLVGGVLTAINSIFVEQHRKLGGAIREIVTAEKIIYIASRAQVNVAIFCDFLSEDLIKFSENLADDLQFRYSHFLKEWKGNESSLKDMRDFINNTILDTFFKER